MILFACVIFIRDIEIKLHLSAVAYNPGQLWVSGVYSQTLGAWLRLRVCLEVFNSHSSVFCAVLD